MHEASFEEAVEQIRTRDPRYARDAYLFVREALDHTQKTMIKAARETPAKDRADQPATEPLIRHVTGQELLAGIRTYALEQFGPMVPTVFEEWGLHHCADFGEIVFNMVEIGLLAKTEKDSREDFKSGYDFDEAFRKPFLPEGKPQGGIKPVVP
jgi:uncharacterized repeat protein (TIGR04138 family)